MTATIQDRPQVRGRSRLRPGRIVAMLAALALIALGWTYLAPTELGGSASYVITDGTSMLPKFHADGLVITRARDSYHVGEIVAYHNKELQRVVMHRIVAIDGDHYVFKGDNNDFVDHYHPTKSELVGQEWVYWPGGGKYLGYVHSPLTFAVVIALITLWAFRPKRQSRRQRRRHHAR